MLAPHRKNPLHPFKSGRWLTDIPRIGHHYHLVHPRPKIFIREWWQKIIVILRNPQNLPSVIGERAKWQNSERPVNPSPLSERWRCIAGPSATQDILSYNQFQPRGKNRKTYPFSVVQKSATRRACSGKSALDSRPPHIPDTRDFGRLDQRELQSTFQLGRKGEILATKTLAKITQNGTPSDPAARSLKSPHSFKGG